MFSKKLTVLWTVVQFHQLTKCEIRDMKQYAECCACATRSPRIFFQSLKNVETAIQTPTGKTSPATASRKTTDVFEDKDFSPKVKKLIRNALDTLSSSDDQR